MHPLVLTIWIKKEQLLATVNPSLFHGNVRKKKFNVPYKYTLCGYYV